MHLTDQETRMLDGEKGPALPGTRWGLSADRGRAGPARIRTHGGALLAKIIRWIVFLTFHLQEYRGPAPR